MLLCMERLPGFRDFYPEPLPHPDVWSADVRQHIFDAWRTTARRHSFREYDGPPLEPLELPESLEAPESAVLLAAALPLPPLGEPLRLSVR